MKDNFDDLDVIDMDVIDGHASLSHVVSSKEEVDEIMNRATASGGKLIKSARDVFWGGYSGYFADPDGHLWDVAWNPHFWPGQKDEEMG